MNFRLLFLCTFIIFSSIGHGQEIHLLPEKKIYKKYYADAISHQFSVAKNLDNREWSGNIGGCFPVLNIEIFNQLFQISVAATVFNTLIKTPGHIKVYTVDYRVDFFIDTKIMDNLLIRNTWGHLSAHYSDDGVIELKQFPINYVRDYTGLHTEYFIPKIYGKIYAGGYYNFHNEPKLDKHTTFQFGGDAGYFFNSQKILFYGAFDIKLKSEVNNGTTQSFQIGIKYKSAADKSSIRVAYTHSRGFEERGQLYNLKSVRNFIGIYYDF